MFMAQSRYGFTESTSSLRAGLRTWLYGNIAQVHDVWQSAHTRYVQISTSCSYTKKVKKKKHIDTMHHLYVVVSERGGVLRND